MAKKDTTIFYQEQIAICRKYFNPEQFGRLMIALFEIDEGNEPEVDDDIKMAFEFMALQNRIDRKKYEARCETNKKNGSKGGAPKGNQNARKYEKTTENNRKKIVGCKNNPNENENENENENVPGSGVHSAAQAFSFFGEHNNVELTPDQRQALQDKFERSGSLIDEVSEWISNAKNEVPDHYGRCVRWAKKAGWPKRRKEKPPERIVIEDPISETDQKRLVADMKSRLNAAIAGV